MLLENREKPTGLALATRGVPPNPTLPVQVEREHIFLNQLLFHDVIEERLGALHRDLWECQAQDTIKLGSDECHARLLRGLPKDLIHDFQVTKLWGDAEGREKQIVKKTDSRDVSGNRPSLNRGCSTSLNVLPHSCLLPPLHL